MLGLSTDIKIPAKLGYLTAVRGGMAFLLHGFMLDWN